MIEFVGRQFREQNPHCFCYKQKPFPSYLWSHLSQLWCSQLERINCFVDWQVCKQKAQVTARKHIYPKGAVSLLVTHHSRHNGAELLWTLEKAFLSRNHKSCHPSQQWLKMTVLLITPEDKGNTTTSYWNSLPKKTPQAEVSLVLKNCLHFYTYSFVAKIICKYKLWAQSNVYWGHQKKVLLISVGLK